ncbi:homeobox-leucine zipper family protein [Striga asiatica]|uniref:Homeobox-leucine zipper family protein n=1 Tax=Striga asiatica TaxID=4170 RepID=A0A5A7PDZ3_STRAF|nr:homeobox-leucine zipper family protein [Striga asiatica]
MSELGDGLGLSLSLRCPENNNPDHPPPPAAASFPLNLFRSPLPFVPQHKTPDLFGGPTRSFYRGIDVIAAAPGGCDEEVMVSSPNSTVSSLSGKRNEREESSPEIDDDGGGDAAAGMKKLRLSREQAAVLESTFREHHTLNPKQKMAIAKRLNLRPRQVEVWFQNRRARTKLKQTEVDCEYLKRWCENLTVENQRLQKEVSELKALKLSAPRFYMNMSPPTTLIMCTKCERVSARKS